MQYDFSRIEDKWQKFWNDNDVYTVEDTTEKAKCYVLDMFPYPSGSGLHVGHPKGYIATDIYSRYKRMQGYNVLHPMGWDAFGLPAENYAIANKVHPQKAVEENVARFKSQLSKIGFNFDWNREINTTDPGFYKWTQWCVKKMFEEGLMEEVYEPINWCPSCKTGLALEDLEDGKCERCSSEIERKPLRQWLIKITEYAERLLADLDQLDWSDSIKEMQRHWIGKSEGAEIQFEIENSEFKIDVFTTRPDTLFGATFFVIAPEHPFVDVITTEECKSEIIAYRKSIISKSDLERLELNKDKTGVFTGAYVINPVNGKKVPIWIADYVMMGYGTGAIMAVPAHDERDFEFAQKYDIEIIPVVGEIEDPFQKHGGKMINSDFLNGCAVEESIQKMIQFLEEKNLGKGKVNYKLRDWVFARQRYWGEPFPFIHTGKMEDGEWKSENVVPVSDEDLPVELPNVENYEPSGTGESPLANIEDWVNTPQGRRETNTMPQWAGSSWYYLRYIDPKNQEALVDKDKEKYWMGDNGIDLYVGGAEHATRHLIYARFWHKFLYDIGVVSTKEPFHKLINTGMILAEDGRKMSKRWGNVVNPDDVIEEYGADVFRMYEMFMGPFSQPAAWSTKGVEGVNKFMQRFLRLFEKPMTEEFPKNQKILLHKSIKKITEDIENFRFNTAIAQMMIMVNDLTREESISKECLKEFTILVAPFAPHIAEELYHEVFGEKETVIDAPWPKYEDEFTVDDMITIVVQIQGKLRGEFEASKDIAKEDALSQAKELEVIQKYFEGKELVKEIYVPGKLVNFVLR